MSAFVAAQSWYDEPAILSFCNSRYDEGHSQALRRKLSRGLANEDSKLQLGTSVLEVVLLHEDGEEGSSLSPLELCRVSTTCRRLRSVRWPWPLRCETTLREQCSAYSPRAVRLLVEGLRQAARERNEEEQFRRACALCRVVSVGDWEVRAMATQLDVDGALFELLSRARSSRLRGAAARALASLFDRGGLETIAGCAVVVHHGVERAQRAIMHLVALARLDDALHRERAQAVKALSVLRRDVRALVTAATAGAHELFRLKWTKAAAIDLLLFGHSLLTYLYDCIDPTKLLETYPLPLRKFHSSLRDGSVSAFLEAHFQPEDSLVNIRHRRLLGQLRRECLRQQASACKSIEDALNDERIAFERDVVLAANNPDGPLVLRLTINQFHTI